MTSKQLPLYDLAEWKNGLAFRKMDFSDKGKPVIKIAELKNGITGQTQFTSGDYGKAVALTKGDMVFSWSGNPETSIDVFWYDLPDGWLNQHIFKVTPAKCVDKKYLYYLLKSFKPKFTAIASNKQTTGLGHITVKDLKEIIVDLPSIEIQKAISNYLYSLDSKIYLNKQINDNLQQQAKSLYEEMFLNNPDADMVSGTLSDIATITMGQSPSGSSYNEESVGEVFYQGRAEFGFRFPTRRLFTTEPKRMAEPGDVLLSVRAPVGDLNVAYEKCCIGRGLGAIHSKTGDSSFMLYTMFALKPQLDVFNGEGTVFGSINRDGLSNLPVNIPSAEEIAKFEATVRPMDNLIRTNYEEICRLQSIRDSLLPKLMSGEIDVSDIQL